MMDMAREVKYEIAGLQNGSWLDGILEVEFDFTVSRVRVRVSIRIRVRLWIRI